MTGGPVMGGPIVGNLNLPPVVVGNPAYPSGGAPLQGSAGTTSAPGGSFVTQNPKTGNTLIGAVELTSGWYVFLACGTGILLSNTKIAPVIAGILGVALLYQFQQLLVGNVYTS